MYEEQYVVCKFGEVMNCAGVIYQPPLAVALISVAFFILGVIAVLFMTWAVRNDKKQFEEAIKKRLANRKTK